MLRLIPALALCCASAHAAPAAVVAMAVTHEGSITLYSDAGICVGKARRAEFADRSGGVVVGCWKAEGGEIFIGWTDGDISQEAAQKFRKVEPA